jgi:hypothetical protein
MDTNPKSVRAASCKRLSVMAFCTDITGKPNDEAAL